ncbi:tetratricopeptide repeat protein [Acidovorax sp. CCYZU-2555]|uniref:L,D-transpeptidase Cds6 family protein n=1 Tax=Acidovorax sp. CCYZU-2555 TaxID=2835042 RepID=UPI001BCB9F3D|nr:tetratricopeptide repeat protein [Acidovorax sp. CCYZU-2555]MBS7778710.1 tetratricopeptide repeat protein [Acidovorax sp. CCYZU-2555]
MLRKRSAVPARFSRPLLAVLLGCLSLGSMPAHASRAVDEVTKLLDQGNAKQAATQADSYLKQNPGDVEMRFVRGVIASEQKQNAQAIKIFSALVREYPSMPEPYNNLAVLYAAEGQERKAAEALEQAIRTNPSYTTAHENLGDLYARMASEAYSKALQLDSTRQTIPAKLALITQLVPTSQNGAKTVVAQANTAPAAPAAPAAKAPVAAVAPVAPKIEAKPEVKAEIKPAPVVETKPVPKVEPKVEPKAVAKTAPPAPVAVAAAPAAPVAPPVVVAAAPAAPAAKAAEPAPAKPAVAAEPKATPAAKPEPKPAAEPKPSVAKEAAEVESAVNAWVTAWEKQDMPGYLDAYSEKFTPANGSSLAKWKEDRRVRIVGKSGISISLQNIQVSVKGDEATAKFRQNYVAGSLNTTTRKTLSMRHERGGWRIVRESTGG